MMIDAASIIQDGDTIVDGDDENNPRRERRTIFKLYFLGAENKTSVSATQQLKIR